MAKRHVPPKKQEIYGFLPEDHLRDPIEPIGRLPVGRDWENIPRIDTVDNPILDGGILGESEEYNRLNRQPTGKTPELTDPPISGR
jgi:hypothetical protein